MKGTGAIRLLGRSPGPNDGFEGRVAVFTGHDGDTRTLIHEVCHSLGFSHICGFWDYQSNDVTGNACVMHYAWNQFMLSTTQAGVLDPWTHRHSGWNFCEEHIVEMRTQNLEDYQILGWGP